MASSASAFRAFTKAIGTQRLRLHQSCHTPRPGVWRAKPTGLLTIGRLRARRGDPDSTTVIDMALGLTPADAPPFMRARLHLARAEAAWLRGDRDTASREAELGLRVAIAGNERFIAGEIAYYVGRSGESPDIPLVLLEAQARELEQDWLGAAEAWRELGCPYEEARAQFESGDSDALHAAFATFDRLGATPMLTAVKQRLRSLGASIPRGPRSSTRESKFGLTARESEVVRFAQLGWTNNEIADRLFLSARTVEHHLSSIYDKMGIRSKREVGDRLRETSDQRILQGNIA